ncbi:uncharacterized protein H6S33_001013 [Morchella sextelata]|uniref:uncharacterized protein n=1 Tax=Morchella sextelata TaxID=1174677 RepID=UPI001D05C202|nr:uncharacterized protein H6S33_001013 [Morchella sextelata]KAH0608785.1 hypothetical protein H6S33_001013 [Morchella sextelata]
MAQHTFPQPSTAGHATFGSPSWTYSGPIASTSAGQPTSTIKHDQDGGTGKEKGPVRESDDLAQYMERSLAIALPYRDQEASSPPAKAANDRKPIRNIPDNSGDPEVHATPERRRYARQKGMRKLANMFRHTLLTPSEGPSAEPPADVQATPDPRAKRPRRKRAKYSYTMSLNLTPLTNDQGSTGQYFAVLLGQETSYQQLLDRARDALAAEGIDSGGGINMAFAIPTVWERENEHREAPRYYAFGSTKEMRLMRNECKKYHGATRLEVHVSVERFPAAKLRRSRKGRGGKKKGAVEAEGGGEVEMKE